MQFAEISKNSLSVIHICINGSTGKSNHSTPGLSFSVTGMSGIREVTVNSWNPALLMPRCSTAKGGGPNTGTPKVGENTNDSYHKPAGHPRKADCNTSSLEHSACDQGHILHCQISQLETWAMPRRNLGVFADLYPDIQHARRSSTSMSAGRDATQHLVKSIGFFQEVMHD